MFYFSQYHKHFRICERSTYVMLTKLEALYRRIVPNRHLRQGIPFLSFLLFGWLGIREFANIRYDIKKKYGESNAFRERMEEAGLKTVKKTDINEEYENLVEKVDLDSWFNIRGPRPEEDSKTIQEKLRNEHRQNNLN